MKGNKEQRWAATGTLRLSVSLGPSFFSSSSKVSRAPVPGAVWEGSLQEVTWRWELEGNPLFSSGWLLAD